MEIKKETVINVSIGALIGIFTFFLFNLFTATLIILFIMGVFIYLEKTITKCEEENHDYNDGDEINEKM